MSEGGGTGIVTTAVFQSLAQLRTRWGTDTANAIWESAIAKIILGGSTSARDLQDLATLIGDRDDETVSVSRSYGDKDSRSRQVSYRRVSIIGAGKLRTLPFGTAVLMLRSAAPIVLELQPWTRRADAATITAAQRVTEHTVAAAFAAGAAEPRHAPATTTPHLDTTGAGQP